MNDYRMNWTLPALPLGRSLNWRDAPLTPAEKKVLDCIGFELHECFEYVQPNGLVVVIAEADCKQLKGAAQDRDASGRATAAEPVAAPPFKVGDRVRMRNSCLADGVIVSASLRSRGEWRIRHDTGVETVFAERAIELAP